MAELDLRPLTLGEILDRSFSLYRRNFLLFAGLTALPHLLTLGLGLVQVMFFRVPDISDMPGTRPLFNFSGITLMFGLIGVVVGIIVYGLSQGGTIAAVEAIYLGRTTSIEASLRRAWDNIGALIGTSFLNGLVIALGMLLLVIPGIYFACRLLICLPCTMIENLGARESLSRSWSLTKGYAGRSFLVLVIYFVLALGIGALVGTPLGLAIASRPGPSAMRAILAMQQVVSMLVTAVVSPLLLIANSIFYFDLRVRKEGFDLQFMMDPNSAHRGLGESGAPSIL